MIAFGEELRRLRKRAGLSQETLAQRAGLSPEAVSLLERGRRTPRLTTARLLAEALHLDEIGQRSLIGEIDPTQVLRTRPLPRYPDGLIALTSETVKLASLITSGGHRLISVTGSGGVGKTRVAVAAAELVHAAEYEVIWFPVGSITEPELLVPSLLTSLAVPHSTRPALAALVERLSGPKILLLIDSPDQVGGACVDLVTALLADTIGLQIMITSRQAMGLRDELVFGVQPLALPHRDGRDVHEAPASRLFLERARLVEGSHPDPVHVADICHQLDGIPFALEIAAARTNVLSVAELAQSLAQNTEALRLHPRVGEPSVVDQLLGWSFARLTPVEQNVLAELSVFRSSFTREGAEAVCQPAGGAAEMIDLLASLVSQSLLTRRSDLLGQARFRMFSLTRLYAHDRAVELGLHEAAQRRHAAYHDHLIMRAKAGLEGDDQQRWMITVEHRVQDVRAAGDWARRHDPQAAIRMASGSVQWFYLSGRYAEGRQWLSEALAVAGEKPSYHRATALAGAGWLALLQCDYPEAERLLLAATAMFEEIDHPRGVAWALSHRGSIARERGDYPLAVELHRRSRQLSITIGDHGEIGGQLNLESLTEWLRGNHETALDLAADAYRDKQSSGDHGGIIWSLINMGCATLHLGEPKAASHSLDQALILAEKFSFREGIAWALNQLGIVARQENRLRQAEAHQRASLAEHRALGDRWRTASVLDELAMLALLRGESREAAWNLGASDRLRRQISVPVPFVERAPRDDAERQIRADLGAGYRIAALAGERWAIGR